MYAEYRPFIEIHTRTSAKKAGTHSTPHSIHARKSATAQKKDPVRMCALHVSAEIRTLFHQI